MIASLQLIPSLILVLVFVVVCIYAGWLRGDVGIGVVTAFIVGVVGGVLVGQPDAIKRSAGNWRVDSLRQALKYGPYNQMEVLNLIQDSIRSGGDDCRNALFRIRTKPE